MTVLGVFDSSGEHLALPLLVLQDKGQVGQPFWFRRLRSWRLPPPFPEILNFPGESGFFCKNLRLRLRKSPFWGQVWRIEFLRWCPRGGNNFTSLSKCSRPFIQSVKSTLSYLKSCNPVGGTLWSTHWLTLLSLDLETLTSLNKESRPFFLGDNSTWSFPSVSSLSDYSIWRSWKLF